VDPMLFPLVRKDTMNQGPRQTVQVGDKVLDYNEKFKLYLATRNPHPYLAPSAAANVQIINFAVTRSGLEGQLLGVTLQHEQPELEKQKSEQLRKEEEFKVQLAGLEAELIQALASSTGNILENTALIESLTKTKLKSAEIEKALEASAKASEELDRQRNVYRPFAQAGSMLYFLIQDLRRWLRNCSLAPLPRVFMFWLFCVCPVSRLPASSTCTSSR
jgi:dynein heavy chain 2, cytosolic